MDTMRRTHYGGTRKMPSSKGVRNMGQAILVTGRSCGFGRLMTMPADTRVFHSVGGVDFDVVARNVAAEPFDLGLRQAAGLVDFRTLRVES